MSSRTDTTKLINKQLTLPSHPDIIHQVEGLIEEIRGELDFREDVYGNVMVAVTEAVNNAIHHGNQGDSSKQVRLKVEMENQYRLVIKVKDDGAGFDPDALADPTSPENIGNIGGRGVFLMRHLSDELSFLEDGTVVEMVFNI